MTVSGVVLARSSVLISLVVLLVLNVLARLSRFGVPGLEPELGLEVAAVKRTVLVAVPVPVLLPTTLLIPSTLSISLLLLRRSPVLPVEAVLHRLSLISASGFVITLLRELLREWLPSRSLTALGRRLCLSLRLAWCARLWT
jgi:hypothetical protein